MMVYDIRSKFPQTVSHTTKSLIGYQEINILLLGDLDDYSTSTPPITPNGSQIILMENDVFMYY